MYRLWHKEFLRAAADLKASKHALHYVQLLPARYTDARVYNMVVTACVAARDLPAALEAAEHLRASGRQLDTILYTNLITGADGSACPSFPQALVRQCFGINVGEYLPHG